MTIEQLIAFAQVYSIIIKMNNGMTFSNINVELAGETLKHLADQKECWTDRQKELYKLMVDYVTSHNG